MIGDVIKNNYDYTTSGREKILRMMEQKNRAMIVGTGMAMPERILTNSELEKMVDTSNQWILSRTGIRERRILEDDRGCSDLAVEAAMVALREAGLEASELELIIVSTVTPDYPTPSTACLVQDKLGARNAAAFDLSAGCTGFVYAMASAQGFISSGVYSNALVIGAEVLSRVTNWNDRSTCVLFGDGAGAAVLKKSDGERGIIDFSLKSDGGGAELLYIPAGGSRKPASEESLAKQLHSIKMNGNEIFKFAVRVVDNVLENLLTRQGMKSEMLDYLFLHQANDRIIEHIRKRLHLSPEKVPINLDRYGNTSSASVPMIMHEEAAAGRLKKNDLVALVAFGAGLTWGGVLLRW